MDFEDLIPQAGGAPALSFDDLVPSGAAPAPVATARPAAISFDDLVPGPSTPKVNGLPLAQQDEGVLRDAPPAARSDPMLPPANGGSYPAGVAVRPIPGQEQAYAPTGGMKVPSQGMFGAMASSLAQGVITGTTDVAAGAARGAGYLADRFVDPDEAVGRAMAGAPVMPTGTAFQKVGDAAANAISHAGEKAAGQFPLDSEYANRSWVKAASMVGGGLPYLAAAALGPVGPVAAAAAGAAGTYETVYKDAIAHGADAETAHSSALLPALVGGGLLSVNAGIMLKGLPLGIQQSLLRPIVDTFAASGTNVGVSELQKLVNNAAAQTSYDPARSLTAGVGDDMLAEALGGAGLHASALAARGVRAGLDGLTAPTMDPALRDGARAMTDAAGRANDPAVEAPAPAKPAPAEPAAERAPQAETVAAPADAASVADPTADNLADLGYHPDEIATMAPSVRDAIAAGPRPEPAAPSSTASIEGGTFEQRAGGVVSRLMSDLGLSKEQAAGVVGNLGHESDGLQAIQERKPSGGGRGGFGWAQWTGSRREAFEQFSRARGLDVTDPEANYQFLVHELQGSESGALAKLRQAGSVEDATRVFQDAYERPGVAATGSRVAMARKALGAEAPLDAGPAAGERTQRIFAGDIGVDTTPMLAELSDLIASHDADGRVNPDYPHADGIQPRDRSTTGSQAQVRDIAANLNPALLMPSPDASGGAPIVAPDGKVVENGNGRVAALKLAYGDPALASRADEYRQHLEAQGFDTTGMAQPVLVSRRDTPLDPGARQQFIRNTADRATLAMNAAERARADATQAGSAIDLWKGQAAGSAANAPFVRSFMAGIPAAERGAMVNRDGTLSAAGEKRVQSAVTAHAYGDQLGPTLDRFATDEAEGMKNISGALTDAAGTWAQMRAEAARGAIPPALDITPDLAHAVQIVDQARQTGRPVSELLGQADFDRPISPMAGQLVRDFFNDPALKRPAGRDRVGARLRAYAEEALKAQPGPDMFGAPPVEAPAILKAASLRAEGGGPRMLAARDEAAAHRATMADEDARGLSPEAVEARDKLRTAAQAMMRFMGLPEKVGLRLVDKIVAGAHGADGSYTHGLVELALDTPPAELPQKLMHESVHALMDPKLELLTPGQRDLLLRGADRWLEQGDNAEKVRSLYGDDPALAREEAVARMGEDAFARGMQGAGPMKLAYGRMLNAVRGMGQMLRGQGYRTADDVFRGVLTGERALPGSREALAQFSPAVQLMNKATAAAPNAPEDRSTKAATPTEPTPARATRADGATAAAIRDYGAAPERYLSLRDQPVEVQSAQAQMLKDARDIAARSGMPPHFIEDVYLVGSQANGRAHANSDYDFLVKFDSNALQANDPAVLKAWDALSDHFDGMHSINVGGKSQKAEVFVTDEVHSDKPAFGSTKYSKRARDDGPMLWDKAGLERAGQGVIPGAERDQRGALQRQVDAPLAPKATQKAIADLPLFSGETKQTRLFGLRDNMAVALRDGTEEPRRKLNTMLNQALFPMRSGSAQAQVVASKFANALRGIQFRYGQIDRQLAHEFKPDERAAMGRALDNQSVFEQRIRSGDATEAERAAFDAGRTGLAGLADKQRATVEGLNELAKQTWQRLADRRLVEPGAEGLPYYMPRQFVMMDSATGARRITREDNQIEATRSSLPQAGDGQGVGGGLTAMDKVGGNLTTSGPKLREHLTPEESAAAAAAKFGDNAHLVTDIRSLLDALRRQEQAVAGRDLVDAIKRIGVESGSDMVREGDGAVPKGYFTLDHPSLWSVGPTGAEDASGKPIYGRIPLHIDEQFRGPLDAVLSKPTPDWYKAIMAVKNRSMSAIMYSPAMHLMVEVGRSLPIYHGNPFALISSMSRARTVLKDRGLMDQAISDGLAPIGGWRQLDAMGIANAAAGLPARTLAGKLWDGETKPQRAWHNLHQKALWDNILRLQTGIYSDMRARYVEKGFSPKAAGMMAAHLANRYAGALPSEQLSRAANMAANVSMFSRSFTLGNLAVMKDMLNGAPSHVKAALKAELGGEGAEKAVKALKRKAQAAFIMDIGMAYASVALAQTGFGLARNMLNGDDLPEAARKEWQAYVDHMLPQWGNEPGKEDRAYIGNDTAGTGTYGRMPVGKVGEEFMGWMPVIGHPGRMIQAKMNPLLRSTWEAVTGRDSLGRSLYNPSPQGIADHLKIAGQAVMHIAASLGPVDQINQVYNAATGQSRGDPGVTAARILGPVAGMTISQGFPGGPEAGVQHSITENTQYNQTQARAEARRLFAIGREDDARRMVDQAYADNPKGAANAWRGIVAPERSQVRLDRNFTRTASDDARARRATVTGASR